jgi:hypothetical protein
MTNIDELMNDEYDLDESSFNMSFDMNAFRINVLKFSSEKLCDIIVSHRYLGFNEEASIVCMEELANRRQSGDEFKFEDFIESKQKELPEINFSVPDLRSVLGQLTTTLKVK